MKGEGNKNKSRELYLVMDIHEDIAALQKLNGTKFQSRRYEVPLQNIFPAIKPGNRRNSRVQHPNISSSSSDGDRDPLAVHEEDRLPGPGPCADAGDDSSSSEDIPLVSGNGLHVPGDAPRRSTRNHNPPSWMNSGEWVR